MNYQQRVREIEAGLTDDDLCMHEGMDDRTGRHDGPVAVSFIAFLPIIFIVGIIGLAFWTLQ